MMIVASAISALAVLRLITSSYLVGAYRAVRGCLTEKIAGKNRRVLSHDENSPLREGSFRQTGRNLDIRRGSCEGIADPWPARPASIRCPGQGRQSHLIPCGSSMAIH